MTTDNRTAFEQRLREAASHLEEDVKRLITYVNDEVVPDVRRNGSAALRSAAAEFDRLARRMDDANRTPHPHPAHQAIRMIPSVATRRLARLDKLVRAVASLTIFVVTFTGCHHSHSTYTASATPPPPPTPIERPTHPQPKPPQKPTPPEPEELDGAKPVSTRGRSRLLVRPPYHNRQAADGSIFDQNALTAAHRTLPMGTTVRVTNLASGASVVVRITDRGPFVTNRILDLSLAAAKSIDVYRAGVAKVRVDAFPHASADPAGRWCVQIGAFLTQEEAIQTKNDLASRYTAAKVIQFQGPTGFWVRINPLAADRTTATHILDSIHLPDADPYLVRLN